MEAKIVKFYLLFVLWTGLVLRSSAVFPLAKLVTMAYMIP